MYMYVLGDMDFIYAINVLTPPAFTSAILKIAVVNINVTISQTLCRIKQLFYVVG